mmetsp:Transcript_11297/g.21778  ORF Transcript_11297/g.21778 Transcript_11297/m.21778 type:complete len:453 (-) Transcript_11297:163-1521(-)
MQMTGDPLLHRHLSRTVLSVPAAPDSSVHADEWGWEDDDGICLFGFYSEERDVKGEKTPDTGTALSETGVFKLATELFGAVTGKRLPANKKANSVTPSCCAERREGSDISGGCVREPSADVKSPEAASLLGSHEFRLSGSGPGFLNMTVTVSQETLTKYPYLKSSLLGMEGEEGAKSSGGEKPAVVLYIHGGGHALMTAQSYGHLTGRHAMVMKDSVVFGIDYRLSPLWKFPVPLLDVVENIQFVAKRAKQWGVREDGFFVMGDSAGGNLAAASVGLLIDRKQKGDQGASELLSHIGGLGLVYPFVCAHCPTSTKFRPFQRGFATTKDDLYYAHMYNRGVRDLSDWRAWPLFTPKRILREFPPTYTAVMLRDTLLDEGVAFHERIKREIGDKADLEAFTGYHGSYVHWWFSKGERPLEWIASRWRGLVFGGSPGGKGGKSSGQAEGDSRVEL